MGEVVTIERGGSPRPIDAYITDASDGLNWVKIGDAPEQGRYINHTEEKIKPSGLSKTRQVFPGDLILSNSMSFGKPYIMGIPGCIHDGWLLIRNSQNVFDLKFLCHMLGTDQMLKQYKSIAAGSTVNNLNKELVSNAVVSVPNKPEQERIGAFLESIDDVITLHQRKLELLKRLRNSLVDRCFIGEKYTMSKLILYHGSPNRVLVSKFGFGEDRHDYGRGFYLTENLELAKEWAVCRPDETNGWVHKYELEMEGLNILDFQKYDVLSWLAELMKHRDAADSRRYKMLAQKFIEKYGIDTCGYDVITGWRANASYFYIAKEFVRDNIDIEILEELLSLGGLGIQFCIKSERAFAQLSEVEQDIMSVDYSEFNDRYNSGTTICRAARS